MDWVSWLQKNKKKIIIGVLAAAIVTLILGLGLGLGLGVQKDKDEAQQWECSRKRCGEKRLAERKCHCDNDCLSAGDCCSNYKHICHGETEWVEDQCDDLSAPKCPEGFKRQPLLLVSLDGLRAEYLQTWSDLIPVLDKLRSCGTSTPYMQAAFPSKTFPNHYTIVTGLYPESNGLIDNNMYDPVFNASFSLGNDEKNNPAWYLGQPIWNTATHQGLKSGTFFWPGSDVKINGSFPDVYKPYDGGVPFEERVFTILKWLQLPDNERPDFYTLYLEEPDKSGHSFGPVSAKISTAIQGVDKIMGQLMNGLKQIDLHRCLNIIVVADHGMEEISCDRKEVMEELVGDVSNYFVNEGPFGRIRARNTDFVLDSAGLVANMSCKKPDQKITPYLKSNLPKRLHYANSRRIEDVTVLVEPKWLFERRSESLSFCSGGNHGYDNDVESMHAMFLSYGPKFQQNTTIEPFANIELYNLMCDVLEISPYDNNGTHGSMNHVLSKTFYNPTHPAEQSEPTQCPFISVTPEDGLGCKCNDTHLTEHELNSRLNLTLEEKSASERKHMMFGRPQMLQPDSSYCILHQEGFISGYSHELLMPLWSSFTIDKPTNLDPLPPVISNCLRADVRLPEHHSPRCDQFEAAIHLTHAFLYPPNLNITVQQQYDALIMSNVAPMYPAFKKIWDYLHNTLLKKYASIYNGINVVTGPVFDYNYDGRYDTTEQIEQFVPGTNITIPTHYFVVLTSCKNAGHPVSACGGELQTVSFLLPHRADNKERCKNYLTLSTELLILLSVRSWLANGVTSPLTYEVTDPITRNPLQCDRCPPGTFLRARCSSIKKSECAPCPQGSFTELWNYIGRCLRCGVCGRNQVVKKECTANSDCQCECKQGYFYRQDYDMCVRHSECPSGQGVLTKGTAERDTGCSVCSEGTFSDISSTHQNCTQHKSCSDAGLQLVLKGSSWHDSVCANCQQLKDGAEYLKEIIPSFFIHHKMNIKRLRRIVLRLPSEEGKKSSESLELNFSELHSRICSWVSSATVAQIQQLPDIVSKTGETTASEKLQRKLDSIETHLTEHCHSEIFSNDIVS
ncbi:venom phosphodiesterase 2 isoform X2 [Gambusia affinis]|uniref:venom phosphodiesterase 2 isoform X2 n=1 Tax=Gambusia affinis TaxID=33528 RepID=UPI001CDBB416|nr:venom phosphodiesterase 2 isoform X2 [Gambusia affinis]